MDREGLPAAEALGDFLGFCRGQSVLSYGNDMVVLGENVGWARSRGEEVKNGFLDAHFLNIRPWLNSIASATSASNVGRLWQDLDLPKPAPGKEHSALFDCYSFASALEHLSEGGSRLPEFLPLTNQAANKAPDTPSAHFAQRGRCRKRRKTVWSASPLTALRGLVLWPRTAFSSFSYVGLMASSRAVPNLRAMFFTYLRRELRRRRKAALVVASGLALGIALVIVVNSVSSGMGKAQDKVLQSLYGLGTDMTVTKAATPTASGSQQPRFQFDANNNDDSKTQSSDRVMVQGFTTLASTTVTKVAGQKGVSDAVGGLSLNVVKVDGQFTRGQFQQNQGSGTGGGGNRGGGTGAPQGEVTGGGANFNINSYSVYGTDVTKPALGPLTSSKITSGRTFTTAEANSKVVVADSAYAKEKKLKVGSTVTIKSVKYKVIGIATATSGDAAANLYVPLKQAQTLSGDTNKVTTIYVKATDSQQISAVKKTITSNVSGTTVTTSADLADTVSGSLSTASSLATSVGKWLSIAVLIAAFLVAGLLTSSAVSRRVREFGTLKALGWKSGRVTRQVVGEAIVNGQLWSAASSASRSAWRARTSSPRSARPSRPPWAAPVVPAARAAVPVAAASAAADRPRPRPST